VAIKALNIFQINSKSVWDCHQSLVKLIPLDSPTGIGARKNGDWWKLND
jgi:hypothetical protein